MPLWRFWPPAAWMGVIFLFSTSLFGEHQTGSAVEAVVRFFYPAAKPVLLEQAHFLARKSAHFMEYAVLAVLWHRAIAAGGGRSFRWSALATLAVCVAYAATDEYHQSFVPGRSARVLDVLIDTAGAAAAVAALWACARRRPQIS